MNRTSSFHVRFLAGAALALAAGAPYVRADLNLTEAVVCGTHQVHNFASLCYLSTASYACPGQSFDYCSGACNQPCAVVYNSGAPPLLNAYVARFTMQSGSRAVIAPIGPVNASAPVCTYTSHQSVVGGSQFTSAALNLTVRFQTVPTVYWAARVHVQAHAIDGGAFSWVASGPGGPIADHTSNPQVCTFYGSATNVSDVVFSFSGQADCDAHSGGRASAVVQSRLQFFIDSAPFTLPPGDPLTTGCAPDVTTTDLNGNGIIDANESGYYSTAYCDWVVAPNSTGGASSGNPQCLTHGFRALDDFAVTIPAPDAGKTVTELTFQSIDTTGGLFGEFQWNGTVNLALYRDDGSGPAGEGGDDCNPLLELDVTNSAGTVVTRTFLENVPDDYFYIDSGCEYYVPGGTAKTYEYRIANRPAGIFTIPPSPSETTVWWIGMRPVTDSTTSGLSGWLWGGGGYLGNFPVRRAYVRPDPNPGSGAPPICDYQANSGGCENLALTIRYGNDLDNNGIPDELQPDCNRNSIYDFLDIVLGTSDDADADGLPDECQGPAPQGTIVAWGRNADGEGNVPAPNSGYIAVAAGVFHGLGLKADGSIVAWGAGGPGQSGDPHYGQSTVPSPNSNFIAVAAGGHHSLGLKADGSIVAWGHNTFGQCNAPAPNTDFDAVAGGGFHSLGLKADGSVVAWGDNFYGQCNVPAPNASFVAVAGGSSHSLGLKADGSIVAWGLNTLGQCNVPAPNTGFDAVAGGAYHSLGLKADGSIRAWGRNDDGQGNVPAPNTAFVAIAGGESHSLGLKADGSLVAWGWNNYGQCNVPGPNSGFFGIAAGFGHSLGLKIVDCNTNGVPDSTDITAGTSVDCETNGVPDECEAAAGFVGLETVTVPNALGIKVCRVYARFCDPGARLFIVFGDQGSPLSVTVTNGTFYQHPSGGDLPPTCAAVASDPPLELDTFVTIGRTCDDSGTGTTPGFSFGTSQLYTNNEAWYISPPDLPQGLPDAQGRVLLGQFSTTDGIGLSGTVNLMYNPGIQTATASFQHSFCSGGVDCNNNQTSDECDIVLGTSADCNSNGVPDECDVAEGTSADCQPDGRPDECEPDCNTNGIPDTCDLAGGTSADCNANGTPDECDVGPVVHYAIPVVPSQPVPPDASHTFNVPAGSSIQDVDVDLTLSYGWISDLEISVTHLGTAVILFNNQCGGQDNFVGTVWDDEAAGPIACAAPNHTGAYRPFSPLSAFDGLDAGGDWTITVMEPFGSLGAGALTAWSLNITFNDCNSNGTPDECDVAAGTSADFNTNGLPDECEATVFNLTRGTTHSSIAAAIAAAVHGDELLAAVGAFSAAPTINFAGKALTLSSSAQINQPAGGLITLADGSALEAAAGRDVALGGNLQVGAGDNADLVGDHFAVAATGGLRARAASVLDVTADGGAQLAGLTRVDLGATLVFSAAVQSGGTVTLNGGALVAGALTNLGDFDFFNGGFQCDSLTNAAPTGALSGYGDIFSDMANDSQVTILGDTTVVGDYANNAGATTTIQLGTLTILGTLTNNGTINGDTAGGRSMEDAPRAAGDGLEVAGGFAAGAGAALRMPSPGLTLKVGGDFAVAINDPARFDMAQATLQLIGLPGTTQRIEVMSADNGDAPAGVGCTQPGCFPIGTLRLGPPGSTVEFVDLLDNDGQGQGAPEALYVEHLIVEAGATLAASDVTIFYVTVANQGTIENEEQLDQVVLIPGDHDADGDVDLADYAESPACMTGPSSVGNLGLGCEVFDFDDDGAIDLFDFGEFMIALDGS